MAAQADAGVWRKAAPAAVEGLATAAQAADVGAWQKAVPAAVPWRGAISVPMSHSAPLMTSSRPVSLA